MNNIITSMTEKHPRPSCITDAKNIIKQILQETALCGLSRSGFFENAAFNGGTALRIFHGLTRFSEDLDFVADSDSPFISELLGN